MPRRTRHTSAGMGPGSAQIQPRHRAAIRTLPQQRACAEKLIEAKGAVEDVAANQAEDALQIERAQHLPAQRTPPLCTCSGWKEPRKPLP